MIIVACPPRGTDRAGCGDFGAPRGERVHRGRDENAAPRSVVLAHIEGTVTRHGYPYSGNMFYRYIEITSEDQYRHRFHYVEPCTKVNERITLHKPIGIVQDIAAHYPGSGMANHIHYEIISPLGKYIDPSTYNP